MAPAKKNNKTGKGLTDATNLDQPVLPDSTQGAAKPSARPARKAKELKTPPAQQQPIAKPARKRKQVEAAAATQEKAPKKKTGAQAKDDVLHALLAQCVPSDNTHEQMVQRITELEGLKKQQQAENERLRRDNRMLKLATVPTAASSAHNPSSLIVKPTGKFNIQTEMGLGGSLEGRRRYKAIQSIVQAVTDSGSLDYSVSWREQDSVLVGKIFRAASAEEPLLKRFAKNWATSALVQQYFTNKHNYQIAKRKDDSYVHRRRAKLTNIGRLEAEERQRAEVQRQDDGSDDDDDAPGGATGRTPTPPVVDEDEDEEHQDDEDEEEVAAQPAKKKLKRGSRFAVQLDADESDGCED